MANLLKKLFNVLSLSLLPMMAVAQNPIVQTCYTADPAPMVYGDRMYVYIDKDEGPDYYVMNEWRVYSSADMVNWTDHGAAMPLTVFSWAVDGSAWASQCIERNGKFYWYVSCTWKESGSAVVGVAVSDSPTGPFKDALGKPLVSGGWGYIDPTPFIDDDGQAYLYFGNPGCYYVKLNEDMISYEGEVVEIEQDEESFGGPKDTEDGVEYTDLYEEGPWLCKRDDTYYLLYAAGGVPEHISYSTSSAPTGPWTYQGQIMPLQDTNSFTNHSGVMDFQGHSYFFYHTGWLPNGGGFTRSVCVEEFEYNADGSFPEITATHEGVSPIGTLNPYERVEAETMAWGLGLETAESDEVGVYVTGVNNGDSLSVREVDFGSTGAGVLTFSVACATGGGTIKVHADTKDGDIIATLPVSYTGGETTWKEISTGVSGITGKHDIWFVFTGDADEDNLFNMDYWKFTEATSAKTLVALNTVVSEYKIDTVESLGNTSTLSVMAVYSNGDTEDVTADATVSADNACITVSGSTITGAAYGESTMTVSYGGLTTTQNIRVRSYNSENTVASVAFEIDGMEDGALLMIPGDTKDYTVTVTYSDGHSVDVTSEVSCSYTEKGIVTFVGGTITAIQDGVTDVTVSYQGEVGDEQTATVTVTVETIALDAFDPNIWGDGTYDKETHTWQPANWGDFGGWYYSEPQDWSAYAYINVELAEAPTSMTNFQLWDTESYWNDKASYNMEGSATLSVDLRSMVCENDATTAVSPETVYRIGFWSSIANPITINSISLAYASADERISLADLNPSIYSEGTYDNENYILQTGQYGFGGWEFSPALDLSDYTYLVVELAEEQSCGATFNIFDEESYWSDCASYEFGSELTLKIDLHTMVGVNDGDTIDPSNITRMGFWSYGFSDIHIKNVYLISSTTAIRNLTIMPETSETVDVYTLAGTKVRAGVNAADATSGLRRGVYIVGGKKVIVK